MWMKRLTYAVLVALLISGSTGSPVRAMAAKFDWCSEQEDTVTGTMESYVLYTTTAGRPSDPISNADYERSRSAYNSESREVKGACSATHHLAMFYGAILTAWKAWLDHWNGTDKQGVEMEKGIQRLTLCASKYFGSTEGATCARWQKKMIAFQSAWDTTEQP